MRVIFPPGQRNNWFDRNPITISRGFLSFAVAVHAATVRWTYTVPAGKKLFIGSVTGSVSMNTAPGVLIALSVGARVTPSGGAATEVMRNVYGQESTRTTDTHTGLQGAVLLAGDLIEGITQDGSVLGVRDWATGMQGTEFDA